MLGGKEIPQNLRINDLNRTDVKVVLDNNETIGTQKPEKSLPSVRTIEDKIIEKDKQETEKMIEEDKIVDDAEIEESEIE